MVETRFVVVATSIITIIVSKSKIFLKKNVKWTCGCGFTDKPLLDDSDLEIKGVSLGEGVHGIYVMPKYIHVEFNNK